LQIWLTIRPNTAIRLKTKMRLHAPITDKLKLYDKASYMQVGRAGCYYCVEKTIPDFGYPWPIGWNPSDPTYRGCTPVSDSLREWWMA
jgi:hypothetical protein